MLPYDAGYDSVIHGANMTNCHFSLFATEDSTKEWERGVQEAKKKQIVHAECGSFQGKV